MRNRINQDHKQWALYLKSIVPGSDAKVVRYWDETEEHHLDIFTCNTQEGVLAATVGVMDCNQSNNPSIPIYTEILMDIRGRDEIINSILSTIGLYMIVNQWKAAPGIVFENMVGMYIPESNVRHIVFIVPFQWKKGMSQVPAGQKIVCPLLAVPISDAEKTYLQSNGLKALESIWSEKECDILSLERQSVI